VHRALTPDQLEPVKPMIAQVDDAKVVYSLRPGEPVFVVAQQLTPELLDARLK
jgi:hypothetical protein